MSVPGNLQSAKNLVNQIAKKRGYLSPENFQQLGAIDPVLCRKFEEAFLELKLLGGSAVITLAKNLYTSKARFVFELLQNADDNKYTRAATSNSVPYVSFHIYPRRIILECNEDGFTNENLSAICSVGKSSKTGAQGYIGEKGIGFKSVFMVASKVDVQSGAFSFSFRHKSGESGMGMITPIWEETDEELQGPLTRFTLHLHDTGDADILEKTRESIKEQFEELPGTILLFMKNLRRIHVAFYNDLQEETSSTTYSIEHPQANHAVLRNTRLANGTTQEDIKRFHVTTSEATNLAKNENRTYTEAEEVTRAYSKSQITLAFPLSNTFTPIIEPQYVFAFLPVRRVGFNFLLQADFVTDASRQDVVQDSTRNNTLLSSIADAFIKAILQFCEHDTLKYQWMRYLPDSDNINLYPLWRSLVGMISDRLTSIPVLYGRSKSQRRLIHDLVRIQDAVRDENGYPLFLDENPEQIVSDDYKHSDLQLLRNHGLKFAAFQQITKWVRSDLDRGNSSRLRSPHTTDAWHTRAAKLLNLAFESNQISAVMLKDFALLPLEDGTWVSALSVPVYFGQVSGMDIPSEVHLRLISKAVTNANRLTLFENLGAKTASVILVRKAILDLYPPSSSPSSPLPRYSIESSKRHLEFLYLTQELAGDDEPSYESLTIHDSEGEMHRPHHEYIYVTNDEPYGARELLSETAPGPNPGDGAPGYTHALLHGKYFENIPAAQGQTWIEWLYDELSVEKCVEISGHFPLEGAGEYLQQHRPEKFLGALFVSYEYFPHLSYDFITSIQNVDVMCRGNRQVPFRKAYFPTKDLERLVDSFVGPDAFFPLLALDLETAPDAIPLGWKTLLTRLEVGIPVTSLDFALDMLKHCVDACKQCITADNVQRLFELYHHIQESCRGDKNRATAEEKVRKTFSEKNYICVPCGRRNCVWALPDECIWDTPRSLMSKFTLAKDIGTCRCRDGEECFHFKSFFLGTLRISKATCGTYVEELRALKISGCDDFDRINDMYEAINTLRPTMDDSASIKEAFEKEALIYVPADDTSTESAWHQASDCVWSKAARLRGRVSLNDDYEALEELFVGFLGIKLVDLPMAIDELKEAGSKNSTSVPEIKDSIWTVNSLLSTESNPPKPSALMKSSILPIRHPHGGVTRGITAIEYFIVDREPLRQLFESKVKLLDFTLEEAVRLNPFLTWIDAHDRRLSHCVKETTSFPGGGASPVSNPDRQISHRAHCLVRIAFHFNSPRSRSNRDLESLYQVLRTSEVCETDGISSELQLSQDGTFHVVESRKMTLHIDETPSGLKIYVPRNKDDQEYVFTQFLGRKLFEWMMKHPVTQISEGVNNEGVNAARDILLAPRSRMAEALEDNGIAEVDIENIDEDIPEPESPAIPREVYQDFQSYTSDNEEESEREPINTPTPSAENDFSNVYRAAASRRHQPSGSPRPVPAGANSSWVPESSPGDPPIPEVNVTTDRNYVALLDKVITAARQGILPSQGPFGMGELHASLPDDLVRLGLRSATQVERDCKIGAAGELYVFELLSHVYLNQPLSGFSRYNWKSNVRRYVSVHHEYSDMEPWNRWETSDITYSDYQGVLTDLLIDKGYLPRDVWEGRRPEYFIEVKTTTSSCNTPFYVSKGQYRRMQQNVLTEANSSKIYVIFRVYHLGKDNMGLRVYLDPESLRLSRQLAFTAETWSVVPIGVNQTGALPDGVE
ncbi:hypothetical protein F4677DRAFT_458573 [Hypoxylon crocopeplum]|nr:hypothetical protein F4677DRAFT_458573 [Hypoxylon crocopeplum]